MTVNISSPSIETSVITVYTPSPCHSRQYCSPPTARTITAREPLHQEIVTVVREGKKIQIWQTQKSPKLIRLLLRIGNQSVFTSTLYPTCTNFAPWNITPHYKTTPPHTFEIYFGLAVKDIKYTVIIHWLYGFKGLYCSYTNKTER